MYLMRTLGDGKSCFALALALSACISTRVESMLSNPMGRIPSAAQ